MKDTGKSRQDLLTEVSRLRQRIADMEAASSVSEAPCKNEPCAAAEEGLSAREERLRKVVENMPVMMDALDASGTIVFWNRECERVTGYRSDEIVGNPEAMALLYPDEKYRSSMMEQWAERGNNVRDWQWDITCKDGSVKTVAWSNIAELAPIPGWATWAVGVDITRRKRTEEALRESQGKYLSILENTGLGISVISPSFEVLEVNRRMREWFPRLEPASSPICYRVYNDPPRDAVCAYCPVRQTLQNGSVNEAITETPQDGRVMNYRIVSSPLRDASGKVVAAIEMVEDITERLSLEEQLRQSQKMEAVGRLAGGVAHDFNNLLTGITGYTHFVLAQAEEDSPTHRDLKEIRELARRAANLTRQLLAFSRRQTLNPVVLNANVLIADTTRMLDRLIGEDIGLDFRPAPDLGNVRADPGQVEQVLMNLAVNARDAMPNGGKLIVETGNVNLDQAYAERHAGVVPGPYVQIAVTDTGCGMDQATREQVFEPFFTTKEVGQGTGLGLATVYGIVKQHGGNIWVYSEVGKGTTFKIYLPRVVEVEEDREEKAAEKLAPRGSETVLIVEDDADVCQVAERLLTAQGYDVLCAATPDLAEEIMATRGRDVQLLLTDVIMPGRSGRELYERVRAHCPQLKVLYMSGYTDDAIAHHGVLEPGTPFMEKPFDAEGLAQKVREVLDQQGRQAR